MYWTHCRDDTRLFKMIGVAKTFLMQTNILKAGFKGRLNVVFAACGASAGQQQQY